MIMIIICIFSSSLKKEKGALITGGAEYREYGTKSLAF